MEGIVMVSPCNKQEVEEAYEAATTTVPPQVWAAFKAEFGVGA
jgi:hypothetical protein